MKNTDKKDITILKIIELVIIEKIEEILIGLNYDNKVEKLDPVLIGPSNDNGWKFTLDNEKYGVYQEDKGILFLKNKGGF